MVNSIRSLVRWFDPVAIRVRPIRRQRAPQFDRIERLEDRAVPAYGGLPLPISVNSSGTAMGNSTTYFDSQCLSADGKYEAFVSRASDLDPIDTNGGSDVYVRNLLTGARTLVSINLAGTASGNSQSTACAISADGRYVAFASYATDLTATPSSGSQIFRRDLQTNTTVLVSFNSAGTASSNYTNDQPSISGNGRFVGFRSYATDLIAGLTDTNANSDIYLRDMISSTMRCVSAIPVGTATGDSYSLDPTVSVDGSTLVFRSLASNLIAAATDNNRDFDVFAWNVATNTNTLVSRAVASVGTGESNADQQGRSVSADGRYVVFSSYSTTYVHNTPDVNGASDVFVRDLVAGTTAIVSVNFAGTAASNGFSTDAVISADGRFVVFRSSASDLTATTTSGNHIFRRDLLTNTNALVDFNSTNAGAANNDAANATVSADGRYVAYRSYATDVVAGVTDANFERDIFVRDLTLNTTKLASGTPSGTATGNYGSDYPVISADGSMVAFISGSTNLVTGMQDNDNNQDLFVRNLAGNTTSLVSRVDAGHGTGESAAGKNRSSLSDDGRYQVFQSYASTYQHTLSDTNGNRDVFLYDRIAQTTVLVSHNFANTAAANGGSFNPAISGDGRYVAFTSTAQDLVATSISYFQVYRWDRVTDTTILLSFNAAGTAGSNGYNDFPSISTNGNVVSWTSSASDLTGISDTNGENDVFVRNLTTNITTMVSVVPAGTASGNSDSYFSVISGNGANVAFVSNATNISGYADTNGARDIFVRILATSTTHMASKNSTGLTAGNSYTDNPSISDDGSKIAFQSNASDMVAGDANNNIDLFVFTVGGGTAALVSRNFAGTGTGNNSSTNAYISGDGSYVVFDSGAVDLLATPTIGQRQIFRRNLSASTTQLISVSIGPNNGGNAGSFSPHCSDDGNVVVFESYATDLVATADTNGVTDIFVRNVTAATTVLASTNSAGTSAANFWSLQAFVCGNGAVANWSTYATNVIAGIADYNGGQDDIYGRDIAGGTKFLVSGKAAGLFAAGCSNIGFRSLSANGQKIVWDSSAINVVSNDNNNAPDVFRFDFVSQSNALVSINSANLVAGNWYADQPTISADGNLVAFRSGSSNLTANDTNGGISDVFLRNMTAGTTELISINAAGTGSGDGNADQPSMSSNGLIVAFRSGGINYVTGIADTNSTNDIFVRNRTSGTNSLVSTASTGTSTADNQTYEAIVSDDGSRLVFESYATNLIAGVVDFNTTGSDIFARNLTAGTNALLTIKATGLFAASGLSDQPSVSDNGQRISFRSYAPNVVDNDFAASKDVYYWDSTTGVNTLVSIATTGVAGNSYSHSGDISGDGRYIVFSSTATNMAPLDSNSIEDIFRRDLLTSTTILISINLTGTSSANNQSYFPFTNYDGSVVVYRSYATDLTATPDTNGNIDIFVRHVPGNTTTHLSRNAAGAGNGTCDDTAVSSDGSVVVFRSTSSNLVAGVTDTNNDWDLFASFRDLVALDVVDVTPDPRGTSVASVDVVLSRTVNLATFTAADFTLTRNGGSNLLTGSESVNYFSGTTYTISGLTGLTGVDGTYVLTVNMSGVSDNVGNTGTGSASDTWVKGSADTTAPTVTGLYFDGALWTSAFRTAAGNTNYGYPAQTGAGQSTTMPWSTVNTIYIKFSENVVVLGGFLGIRGVNNPLYNVGTFSYDSVNFVAKWTLAAPVFDTDWVIADLDGSSGSAVTDIAGNKLAGTWTENSSTFPTSGAAGVNFKYRFKIAVGDADRNGQVRNPDTNLVRANLFIDAGAGGYNIYSDIDGNGLTRNADLNAVRSHLFIDPPAGPGPNRPIRGGDAARSRYEHVAQLGDCFDSSRIVDQERISRVPRRPLATMVASVIDALFEVD